MIARTWTQLRIVQTVADAAGDPDQATRLSPKAVELAGELGRSEDWDTGVTVSNGMWFLIRAAVRAGDLDRAESLARTVPLDFSRADTLAAVPAALLTTGSTQPADTLVAELIHARDPSALTAILDDCRIAPPNWTVHCGHSIPREVDESP